MNNTQKNQNQNQNKGNGKDEVKVENTNKVIQMNETQEVTQELKEIAIAPVAKFDLETAKAIVNGTVEKTKLRTVTDLEIAKLEHEANIKFKEVDERLELRRMELAAKTKIVKEITDTALIVGVVGSLATASVLNTRSNNTVKIKKMEHGILD